MEGDDNREPSSPDSPTPTSTYFNLSPSEQLLFAARNGDLDRLRLLLDSEDSIDINCKGESKSNRGWTPLHLSSYFGQNEAADFLIQHGANLNTVNDVGDTPLHKAAYTGREDVVYLLLRNNADVNIINAEGHSPKYMTNNTQIKKLIEAAEQYENLQTEKQFLSAARSGDIDKLSLLLKTHPNINAVDEYGNSALHCASYRGQHLAAVMLLQNGIDTTIKNNKGQLAMEIAKNAQMKQLLDVKPIKKLQKSVQRYETFILKRSKVMGWSQYYCVLERGVMSYFQSRADATTGSRRKGFKHLDNARIETNTSDEFVVHFNDGKRHNLSLPNRVEGSIVSSQKLINALQEHIDYSNHYINHGLNFEDDDDLEDLLPLGSMQDTLQTAQAHQTSIEKNIAQLTTHLNNIPEERQASLKQGNNSLTGIRGQLSVVVGASRDMCNSLSHCLTLFNQQEEIRRLQLKQEMEKSRVLQEALQVLATEHHDLEQSISGHISPQRCYSSEDDEFFDCDEGQEEDERMFDDLLKSKLSTSSMIVQKPVLTESNGTKTKVKHKKSRWSSRTCLPVPAFSRNDFSVWSILKQCIGKELSKVTMPVIFNEPLSFLQRLTEYMEYSSLLNKAASCDDPVDRIQYIAAFAVSACASNWDRLGKPFNPLLGETYELDREEFGFRIVCEQVSHHPPISAFHVESKEYRFHGAIQPKIRFWGKSVEVQPKGIITVELLRHNEVYTWHNVGCSIHNIIVGKLWIEHTGVMEIINHKTDHRVSLTYKPMGWFSKQDLHKTEGYVYDPQKQKVKALYGSWVDSMFSVEVDLFEHHVKKKVKDTTTSTDSSKTFSLPFNNSSKSNSKSKENGAEEFRDCEESLSNLDLETDDVPKKASSCDLKLPSQTVLWQADEKPENNKQYFSFTLFAMMLNELKDEQEKLPPTDSRLRPDIRRLEDGEIDAAADEKVRLEEKQRAARKERKKNKEEWSPRWFRSMIHPHTAKEDWMYVGDYFARNWVRCPDIF